MLSGLHFPVLIRRCQKLSHESENGITLHKFMQRFGDSVSLLA